VRAVVQRCRKGSVLVEGRVVGSTGPGFVVFIGVGRDDTPEDAEYLADKVFRLRVFEDSESKMNKSLADTGGSVLAVSQFTLYADTRGGRRPSFVAAAPPEVGEQLFDCFVEKLRQHGVGVETGEFGAHMLVEISNDGPVTILIDSKRLF